MIRNNMMNGLYTNMSRLDNLYNQMSTLKKIQRPSDDPIIAGRSLKLRINVLEATQYKSNTDEATSWMGVTEKALDNITEIVKDITTRCVQASTDTLTEEDREKIRSDIDQLWEQLQQEVNATYAGRYVFSGYKTNEPPVLSENKTLDANVTIEDNIILSEETLLKAGTILPADITLPDGTVIQKGILAADTSVPAGTVLPAYNLKDTLEDDVVLSGDTILPGGTVLETGTILKADTVLPMGTFLPAGTELNGVVLGADTTLGADTPLTDDLILTAPLTLGADLSVPSGSMLAKDTILPTGKTLHSGTMLPKGTTLHKGTVNPNVLGKTGGQNIRYEIGVGSTISVNTLGMDSFISKVFADVKAIRDGLYTHSDGVSGNEEDLHKLFESKIAAFNARLSEASEMTADLGSRVARLEYTAKRLAEDHTNFKELLSKTEDIDIEEVYTEFNAQYAVYQSALQATSRVIMNTLADFLK